MENSKTTTATTALNEKLVRKALKHVRPLFETEEEVPMFHNQDLVREAVKIGSTLAEDHHLPDREKNILLLALTFYYSGFHRDPKNFLNDSILIARKFLDNHDLAEDDRDAVTVLMNESPSPSSTLLARIMHDALAAYLGRKRFFRKMELLRVEREFLFRREYTDHDWERIAYKMLLRCNFMTDAAREKYTPRHVRNIRKQRQRINKAHKITVRKQTGKEFGRGVDTLYRANYNNHISLSSIADGKANMMISINTLILTVIVGLSGAGFTFSSNYVVDNLRFVVPMFILLIGALTSVVFAILSARPKVTTHKVNMKDVNRGKSSLMFFGNFLQVPLDEYVNHLETLKQSQKRLYDSMSVDLYFLGTVLQRKYRLLKLSYNSFMAALVLSVLAFIVIFFSTNVI